MEGTFKHPSDVITREMVDKMIGTAEINIRAATVLAYDTAEETAEKLRERLSTQRRDAVMNSMQKFVDDFYGNLPPKEEMEAIAKDVYAHKTSKK